MIKSMFNTFCWIMGELTAAPICAAFCSKAVADMRAAEEEEGKWWSLEMEDENMDPAERLKGFGGIGIRSWWGSVMGGEAAIVAPRLASLLLSSVKASQYALWVMKLSLLPNIEHGLLRTF